MCNLLVLLQDDYYILEGVLTGSLVFRGNWQQSLPRSSIVHFHYGEILVNITCPFLSISVTNTCEVELVICLMLSGKQKNVFTCPN